MCTKGLRIALAISVLALAVGVVSVSAAPSQANVVHVVQRGETLSAIAVRYGVNMWTIARYNGIANPNHVYVGQRLIIPIATTTTTTGKVHVVQPGETLTIISVRYGVNAWTIARANGITNLNHIYIGQRLTIPGTTTTTGTTSQPSSPSQPSLPATYPGPWSGEYFGDISLTSPPYVTRQDEAINFNWAYGPPAGGMPTNSFSVRWTGQFNFGEGTYRFYARVDDGVRVYIDGVRIIDSWRDGGVRTLSSDTALQAGTHTIQVDYYDRIQIARIHFWYRQLSGPKPTPTPGPSGPTNAPTNTFYAEYYNGEGLSGSPVATRNDDWIGFDWGVSNPMPQVWTDHFSIRWTRTVQLEAATYNFCTRTDDGVRLWVDNTMLINEWHGNNGVSYCSPYKATAGGHTLRVEYYEHQGNALAYVWWDKE